MSEVLNIALVGCGYWGKNYLRLFNEIKETNVITVCDKNEAVKGEIVEKYPHVGFTTEVSDLIDMDEVDAVVIATTTEQHYEVAKACIEAGKHVLIEKPMTATGEQSLHLVQLAKEYNVKLMVGHIYLHNTAIQTAKEYLRAERFGQLHYLYTQRTNLGPIRHDVNVAWDLAPHDISVLNYFMDASPIWVSAVGQNLSSSPHADVAFITLGYPNNCVGHVHVSWADPSKVRDIVIVGSQQRIYLNDMDPQEPIRIFERGLEPAGEEHNHENRFTIRDGDIISPRIKLREPLREQCNHFIDCIVNDKTPLSNGESGAAVVQILEAIDKSMQEHGKSIYLETGLEVS